MEINLNDLKNVIALINAMTARGAIRPEEMVPVGQLYTKLSEFVAQAEASNAPADENDTAAEGASNE